MGSGEHVLEVQSATCIVHVGGVGEVPEEDNLEDEDEDDNEGEDDDEGEDNEDYADQENILERPHKKISSIDVLTKPLLLLIQFHS